MAGSFACKTNAGVAPQEQLLGTMAGNRRLSKAEPARVSSIPIYIIPRLGHKRQQPQKFSDAMSFLKLLR